MMMREGKGSKEEREGYRGRCRRVLITGVSKGLGRALALEFAKRGHTIIGCSRDQNKLDSLRSELSSFSSSDHFLFNADVKSNDSVQEFARVVLERNLVPDIIINNAGVANKKNKMWEIPVEEFDNVIDINIKGIANILRHFIPPMISNNQSGIIINMSSIAGRTEFATFSPYCASKWAVEGFSKSIAKELPEGMTVVALDPGVINTDMLVSSYGDLASRYQLPEPWSLKAVPMILDLTAADNGASLMVKDPGNDPLH